jgi:hypothetical protein
VSSNARSEGAGCLLLFGIHPYTVRVRAFVAHLFIHTNRLTVPLWGAFGWMESGVVGWISGVDHMDQREVAGRAGAGGRYA